MDTLAPNIVQKSPFKVEVEAGKTYWWCACGRSAKQPFCDGSHKGSGFSPVEYTAEAAKALAFCGCKHSQTKPLCDGTHRTLAGEATGGDFLGRIAVDYGKSFEQMVASGDYGWVGGDVTPQNFPISGSGSQELEARLFHLDRFVSSEEAVREIVARDKARPWSPGRAEHLFAFGARYPLEQQKSPLVALGSTCTVKGKRGVICLYGGGGKRMMRVDAWDGDWASVFGFLAVR